MSDLHTAAKQALIDEATIQMADHPSKDARFFAKSVYEYLMAEPEQPVPVAEPRKQEPVVAEAWQQGYDQGVADERISEANIGIAGFGAKVNPARNNPYTSQPTLSPAQRQARSADTWVGLTDEQISEIAINTPPMVHEFARAIEAAHGIQGDA